MRLVARVLVASLVAVQAQAFCGFYVGGANSTLYNEATMVILLREGTTTVLSMRNDYSGPPENFAMVVPVPVVLSQDSVHTLPAEVFQRIDTLAAPRLVEYWEQNPCYHPPPMRTRGRGAGGGMGAMLLGDREEREDLGVRIEAQFAVGEYDIVILSAQDSNGLDTWLRREGYHIPEGAEAALRPYVQQGTKFFVARVNAARVHFENGHAVLSPLRMNYDSPELTLPVRLGLINSHGTQDLLVHVLARAQRYEVANYPNAFIPTNIAVQNSARESFGAFYAALFDKTLERHPGAVVTEYAWQAGSCDPCPGPALQPADLNVLGGDVAHFGPNAVYELVLTRLHYRYGRNGLSDDLVFRAASPVVGGRGEPYRNGRMDRQVRPDSSNNFQGRYAVLHRWTGPVECAHPERGVWGGPPNGGSPRPVPAMDLAHQRRGAVLEHFLAQPLPELLPARRGGGGATPDARDPLARRSAHVPASGALVGCSTGTRASSWALPLALGLLLALRRRSH